jgi:hypothetical protein
VQETADLSKFAVETGNALSEMEKHIAQILNLQDYLTADSSEQAAETEKAFQIFIGSIAETEMSVDALKQSEKSVAALAATLGDMLLAVDDFKLPPGSAEANFRIETDFPNAFENTKSALIFEEKN